MSILMTSQAILNSRFSDASETSLSIQVSSGRNIRSLILRQGRVKKQSTNLDLKRSCNKTLRRILDKVNFFPP